MSRFYLRGTRSLSLRSLLFPCFFLLAFQLSAAAQRTAVTSGNFSDPNTWSPAGVPNLEPISIASGVDLVVDVNATVLDVQINNGSGPDAASLAVADGVSLTGGYVSFGASNGAGGILRLNGAATLYAHGFSVNGASSGNDWVPGSGSLILTANNTLPALFDSIARLTILNGTTTTHVSAPLTISSSLTVAQDAVLDLETYPLTFSGAVVLSNTGTIETANTTASPLPDGQTWGYIPTGLGAVLFKAPGGGQTIPGGTYNNLYVQNSDPAPAETVAAGNLVTGGEIAVLSAASTLNLRSFRLSAHPDGGIGSQLNAGTIRTQYVGSDPLPTGRNWGGTVIFDAASGGQKVVFGTYNNLTVTNNGTSTASTIVVNGALVTSPTTLLDLNSETLSGSFDASGHQGTLEVSGTTPFPAGKTFGGTVLYNSNGAQNIVAGNYQHLTITTFRNGDLTLPNGIIGVSGDLLFDATLEGASTFIRTGTVFDFNGSTAQTIDVSAREIDPVTEPFVFTDIVLSGGGQKTLARPAALSGVLTLTNGVLETSAGNLLTFTNGATASGGSTASYIQGPVRRLGLTAFVFPLGGGGVYAPLGISDPGAGGDFTARYVRASARALDSSMQAPLRRVSNCEYWNLLRTGGSNNPVISLGWSAGSSCDAGPYITNPASLVVARYDGSDWVSLGNSGTAVNGTSGQVFSNPASDFGNLTLGSTGTENTLPLTFISVRARKQNGGVALSWTTATEYNVAHYVIERSADGRSFVPVAQVRATANNGAGASYEGVDGSRLTGVQYYRIKGVDIDGKLTFSSVLRLSDERAPGALSLFPNPARAGNVVLQASDLAAGRYELTVFDVSGRALLRSTLEHHGGSTSRPLTLPAGTAPGLYSLRLSGNGQDELKTFLLQ